MLPVESVEPGSFDFPLWGERISRNDFPWGRVIAAWVPSAGPSVNLSSHSDPDYLAAYTPTGT